jgi:hypothetical protein
MRSGWCERSFRGHAAARCHEGHVHAGGAGVTTGALLLFLNDIRNVTDEAYVAWHRDHHVPQRLLVPGMLAAHRYERLTGAGHRFLTIYELADAGTLAHPDYVAVIARPDSPTIIMRKHLMGGVRVVLALDSRPRGLPPAHLAVASSASSWPSWATGAAQQPATSHPLAASQDLPPRLALVDVGVSGSGESPMDTPPPVAWPWHGIYRWSDTQSAPD